MLHVRIEAPAFVTGAAINRAVNEAIAPMNTGLFDAFAIYGPGLSVVVSRPDPRPVLAAAYERGYALAPFDAASVSPIDRAVEGYGTAYARGYMDRLRADHARSEYRVLVDRLRAGV